MLKLENVGMSFGKKQILKDITVSFENKTYALLGPNGSGKTTLIRSIAGLYPFSGKIEKNGLSASENRNEFLADFGYLPQAFGSVPYFSVREALELFCVMKNIPKSDFADEISRCLEKVGLSGEVEKKISKLSGGMLRRVGIAQALLGSPSVLLLDEPTAGLDPEERIRFSKIVADADGACTTVISTHIISDVKDCCDEVIILLDGEIVFIGSVEQLAAQAAHKVFAVLPDEKNSLQGRWCENEYVYIGGRKMLRIVTNEAPKNAVELEPEAEDGYLCCLKNI